VKKIPEVVKKVSEVVTKDDEVVKNISEVIKKIPEVKKVPEPSGYKKEFECPITFELMIDPVICADGFTYERKNIQDWINLVCVYTLMCVCMCIFIYVNV
jgi:hypothetical protein